MRFRVGLFAVFVAVVVVPGFSCAFLVAQMNSVAPSASVKTSVSAASNSGSSIALRASSTMSVASEMGGAFMSPSKCDDGNLYIRKFASDRPMLGPVVKIDPDGKRVALFDPAAFSQLALDRADAFSPASDGGLYRIAQSGVLKPHIYVLRFSSDGSPSTPTRLDADLEVYAFAPFSDGNILVSGVRRDLQNKNDPGHNFTAVFSADGRELAQLTFRELSRPSTGHAQEQIANDAEKSAPVLDLAEAEVGSDGNLYVMRGSSPALVYVIASSGKSIRTIKIASPAPGGRPSAFHISGNRLAVSFQNDDGQSSSMVIADAQTGRKIASYDDSVGLGTVFACYEANEGVFTFLKLGEENTLEVIRAEPQ